MHKLSKITTLILLCTRLTAESAEVIGKIEIPSLTDTANNVSQFTKPITPVIPIMIAGGLIAVSFNKRYDALDITSPIRAGIFAEDGNVSPRWCFSIDKKNEPENEYVKLSGARLYLKESNERFIMSESKDFLQSINALSKPGMNSSDISLEIMPRSYLEKCPEHFNKLKVKVQNKLANDKSPEELAKLKSQLEMLQTLLGETELFNLAISASGKYIEVNSLLKPAAATAFMTLIAQLSSQNLSLAFPSSSSEPDSISLDKLAGNIDLLLKMIAPDKAIADKDMAVFTKIMKDSTGYLAFKNDTAILNLKISQETVKLFIPEKYLQKAGRRQRIQF